MKTVSDVDLAWVSGLFEGEGCVGWIDTRRRGNNAGYVTIAMVDKDIIDRVERVTGIGRRFEQKLKSGKTLYQWRVNKQEDVVAFLTKILPFMGQRRTARIKEVMDGILKYEDPRLGNRGKRRWSNEQEIVNV